MNQLQKNDNIKQLGNPNALPRRGQYSTRCLVLWKNIYAMSLRLVSQYIGQLMSNGQFIPMIDKYCPWIRGVAWDPTSWGDFALWSYSTYTATRSTARIYMHFFCEQLILEYMYCCRLYCITVRAAQDICELFFVSYFDSFIIRLPHDQDIYEFNESDVFMPVVWPGLAAHLSTLRLRFLYLKMATCSTHIHILWSI